jgi:hypothetical protein
MHRAVACGLVSACALGLLSSASAQPTEKHPYLAAVTADDVNVRAGADFRYYPFGRVHQGDVLKVIGEQSGWARVVTRGPAFRKFFGYLKYPRTEAGHFRLAADGKTGVTLGPTDLFAPNLDAGFDPKSSWKPALQLPAERTVQVIATFEAEGDLVHKIALPDEAEGWISATYLRRATPAETAAWEAALARTKQPAKRAQPVDEDADEIVMAPRVQPPLGRDQTAVVPAGDAGEQTTAVGVPSPTPDVPRSSPAPKPRRRGSDWLLAEATLKDLEAAYKRLLAEPVETAEVGPLRLQYLELAEKHADHRTITEYAKVRARQLELWSEVRHRKRELTRLVSEAQLTAEDAEAARLALEAAGHYAGVGRLDASIVYDGNRLPKLLRLREPTTGRTLGYLRMDERFDYAAMIGRLVGIVGEKSYDGGLRVNLFQPRRIDVLDPEE